MHRFHLYHVWFLQFILMSIRFVYVGRPLITTNPTGGVVPMGSSITLMCRARGLGILVYSWENKGSGGIWTTVSDGNTTSYTTDTILTSGEYRYRCRVNNEAGSVVSNNAIVNVYGKTSVIMTSNNWIIYPQGLPLSQLTHPIS